MAVEPNGSDGSVAVHPPEVIRLNLGAGNKRIDGWISVDLAGEPDVRADVLSLPFDDGYADEVMAIHLFEHLYRWQSQDALREWLRVLKRGGRLILELPDFEKCCRNILYGSDERMGIWGLFGDPGYKEPLMVHKWAWTADSLTKELLSAGFRRVKRKKPQFHKVARDMRLEAIA